MTSIGSSLSPLIKILAMSPGSGMNGSRSQFGISTESLVV